MDVFISWSGLRSRYVAAALHEWLKDLIQNLEPWMSQVSIDAGERWSPAIAEQLESAYFGIVVVTPENAESPWLNFEAGAIAKSVNTAKVCPYLIEMRLADIPRGPLNQFQAKLANREDTFELVSSLNQSLGDKGLDDARLRRSFDLHWPTIEAKLANVPDPEDKVPPKRSPDEVLDEILSVVRRLDRSQESRELDSYLLRRELDSAHSYVNPSFLSWWSSHDSARDTHSYVLYHKYLEAMKAIKEASAKDNAQSKEEPPNNQDG